ncbi:MAG TPA: hypothetical protein VM491_15490 [Burkholderiaceae bacterium]|nr:hypothetical protein [Burkholderiaceae bacterium]
MRDRSQLRSPRPSLPDVYRQMVAAAPQCRHDGVERILDAVDASGRMFGWLSARLRSRRARRPIGSHERAGATRP